MLSEMWSDLRYRVRALFRRDTMEHELDEELRFHVDREAEKYERLGVPRDEALRRARLAFGGVDQSKEESRDSRGTAGLERVLWDLRYAARSLRHHPAFTLAVVLTLAIGIGANTAIFALIDALMLRALPVPHPEQLVTIGDPAQVNSGWTGSPATEFVSYPVYADVRDGNTVLSDMYASGSIGDLDVSIDPRNADAVEHPRARVVTANFFSLLQVPAYAGRTFAPDSDKARRGEAAVVISYEYWRRRFAADRSVLGRIVRINGVPVAVVGIAPPSFTGDVVGERPDFWIPMMMEPVLKPRANLIDSRATSWLQMMGRLRPGVTLARARAELSTLEARSIRAHVTGVHLSRFEEDLKQNPIRVDFGPRGFSERRDEYGRALIVLMAAVVVVILVVCANVSNLMLSRAAARGREMTVRMTLGAARRRLVQQLLTESVVLAVVAAAFGLLIALWGERLLLMVVGSDEYPVALDMAPNARVLAFTAATMLGCVMLFGLAPAFRATRVDLATALRAHGRSLSGSATRLGRIPVAKLLVVAQVALSTLLLIGSGLLVRSMQRLMHADLGFDRDHVVGVHVATSRTNYMGARLALLRRDLAERAARVPGVDAAAYTMEGVFSGGQSGGHVSVAGFVAQADSERQINYDMVGPGYFRALRAHILRGRDFEPSDIATGANVAAVNETMANYYFRGRSAIGGIVTLDSVAYTVVGVVRDVQERSVRGKPVRRLYMATFDSTPKPQSFELVVHVGGDPSRFVAPLRQALLSADRTLPLEIEPLADRVRDSVREDRLLMQVTAFFGIITLVLAALGLYGVTAYATSQRTSEFGLRIALGAEPGVIGRMVVRETVGLVVAGIVLGAPAGIAATRLIRERTFGVGAVDVPSLSAALVVLIVTALIASWIPAMRAVRVGPLEALATET